MGRGVGGSSGDSGAASVFDSSGLAARHKPAKTIANPRLVGCPKGPCRTTKMPALKRKMGRVFPARIWRMAKIAELPGQRGAPKQEGDAKDRPAFQEDAGPFIFREEEGSLAGEKIRAAAGADAEPVAA